MKKSLHAVFAAALVISGGAAAADRELLFGPGPAAPSPAPATPKPAPRPAPKPVTPAPAKVEPPKPAPVTKAPTAPAPVPSATPMIVTNPAPAPAPATSPGPAVAAAVPVMPPLAGAPIAVSGTDQRAVRDQLAATLKDGISVGFFPSASAGQDTFNYLNNYLALANYLSKQTGLLVTLVPEKNLGAYAKRFYEHEYPIIFVNAAQALDALNAGYVPIAHADEILAPGFVVKADSPLKDLSDLKGKKLAWANTAQITMLAQAELVRRDLQSVIQAEDVGTGGRTAAFSAVNSGSADTAVVRTTEAQAAVKQSEGKLRLLGTAPGAPALGVWVRKDLVDSPLVKRFASALTSMSKTGTPDERAAIAGFERGFRASGVFVPANLATYEKPIEAIRLINEKWPTSAFATKEVKYDEARRSANNARPVTYSISQVASQAGGTNAIEVREQLVKSMRASINIGVYPSAQPGQYAHLYSSNYLPLANYLSRETGALVNLIVERDVPLLQKRIAELQYPIVFAAVTHTLDALKAGYVPWVQSRAVTSQAFLVRTDESIKTFDDMKGRRLAYTPGAQHAVLARAELVRRGVWKDIKYEEITQQPQGIQMLKDGVVDMAVARIDVAKDAVAKSEGKLKIFFETRSVPAVIGWVRADMADSAEVRRLRAALLGLNGSTAEQKLAREGFHRSYRTDADFVAADVAGLEVLGQDIHLLNENWEGFKRTVNVNADLREANRQRPLLVPTMFAGAPAPAKAAK